jgi:hypothetical protein
MEDTTREEERFSFSLHSNSKRRRVDGLDLNRIPKPKEEDSFFLLAALSNQVKVWWSGSGQGLVVQLCGTFRPETLRGTSIHHIPWTKREDTHTKKAGACYCKPDSLDRTLGGNEFSLFSFCFFSFHHFSTLHRIASASDYPPHLFSRK